MFDLTPKIVGGHVT